MSIVVIAIVYVLFLKCVQNDKNKIIKTEAQGFYFSSFHSCRSLRN